MTGSGTLYRIGAFAARAGVTVRTVRYYDRPGLLQPSGRSDAGQRLYTDRDLMRLQHILTLKLLGLTLDEIADLLANEVCAAAELLERQKQLLRSQADSLLRLCTRIEQAQAALGRSPVTDLEQFIEMIQVVMMHSEKAWLSQFLSDARQQTLATAETRLPFAQQRAHGLALQTLFSDIQQHWHNNPRQPEVQALVARWDAEMQAESGLQAAYAAYDTFPALDDAPPALRAWAQNLRAAALFIERARAAAGGSL